MEVLFSIASDTLSAAVAPAKLHGEIEASSIVASLDRVDTNGDELKIVFLGSLSAQENTTLSAIVGAHDGQQIVEPASPNIVQLAQVTPNAQIPKVAIYEAEGDFSSVVSHNFSNSATWPAVDNSTFILEPAAGKRMFLKKAEVQFTHDIQLSGVSELFFDVWVYNPLFDVGQAPLPELDTYNPMADPPRNQLRFLFERIIYTSILDVLNVGNAHFTMAPVDGIAHQLSTVQFNYPRAIPLLSSQGGQVRCKSNNDVELGGTFCTITFTTSSEDES